MKSADNTFDKHRRQAAFILTQDLKDLGFV
jgi:hypothetical protein